MKISASDDFFAETFGFRDPTLVREFSDRSLLERVKRGSKLVEVGEPMTSVIFLLDGIVRGYVLDENGREMTDCFAYHCGDAILGCGGLYVPSLVNFETLSDCTILRIAHADLTRMIGRSPQMMEAYIDGLTEALKRHWEIKRILYLPAMQRYQWFLNAYPGLIDVVSKRHVASFLGITPVSLSRLRGKMQRSE